MPLGTDLGWTHVVHQSRPPRPMRPSNWVPAAKLTCQNYGNSRHSTKACTDPVRCFACNGLGHRFASCARHAAPICTKKQQTTHYTSVPPVTRVTCSSLSYKDVLVGSNHNTYHTSPPQPAKQCEEMDLEGRPAFVEIDMQMKGEIERNLTALDATCIVVFDRRASHRAISLMFQRFLLVEEKIKVADLIWEHKVYLVTFPSTELAHMVADSGPESFEGFRFYNKLWSPEWDTVSIDAHLAVWVEVGKLPAHFYDSTTTRYILNHFGFILKFSQNFRRCDNMEAFAILLAVPSTRILPKTLCLKTGVLNYNDTLKPVSVSAVATNIHLDEQRWEFLTRGE